MFIVIDRWIGSYEKYKRALAILGLSNATVPQQQQVAATASKPSETE